MNIEEFKQEIERLNRKKLPIELWVQTVFATVNRETIDEIACFLKECPEVMGLACKYASEAPSADEEWSSDFLVPATRLLKGEDPLVAKKEYIQRNQLVVEVLREWKKNSENS
ncbi:hypothetical protein [Microbulbifer sp. PAAF003]|uniref:hypothetical protein n=1 Tax=Microbulbifer sp. PAAF003 TaxID=3243375 RepID=UPI004039C4E1